MRTDCRHYQSRTYGSGEAVRKCVLDLAPEAPWRCPADCPKYERKMIDAGWQYGSMVPPKTPAEPASEAAHDPDVAALLTTTSLALGWRPARHALRRVARRNFTGR